MNLKIHDGRFLVSCVRRNGRLRWNDVARNSPTTEGLTDLLAAFFAAGTQRSWYVGLISGSGYTGVDVGDTAGSHAGWSEFTGYSGTRPAYTGLTAAGARIAAAAPAQITLTSSGSVRGFFLASSSTRGGTSGVLWCTGLFAAARAFVAGETLRVDYAVRAAGG